MNIAEFEYLQHRHVKATLSLQGLTQLDTALQWKCLNDKIPEQRATTGPPLRWARQRNTRLRRNKTRSTTHGHASGHAAHRGYVSGVWGTGRPGLPQCSIAADKLAQWESLLMATGCTSDMSHQCSAEKQETCCDEFPGTCPPSVVMFFGFLLGGAGRTAGRRCVAPTCSTQALTR